MNEFKTVCSREFKFGRFFKGSLLVVKLLTTLFTKVKVDCLVVDLVGSRVCQAEVCIRSVDDREISYCFDNFINAKSTFTVFC